MKGKVKPFWNKNTRFGHHHIIIFNKAIIINKYPTLFAFTCAFCKIYQNFEKVRKWNGLPARWQARYKRSLGCPQDIIIQSSSHLDSVTTPPVLEQPRCAPNEINRLPLTSNNDAKTAVTLAKAFAIIADKLHIFFNMNCISLG